nr:glycosyltransferase family 8 C-terminal domain-containing protein [Obesumbacterium proteus]
MKKAGTLAEMQKYYKHVFKQKKYFLGVLFLIQYKIKKLKSK